MKPYLIQLGIFACYSILCFLWSLQSDPGGGGYGMGAIIFEVLFVITHIVVTVILVSNKQWTSHYLFAIIGIAALIYILIGLSNS